MNGAHWIDKLLTAVVMLTWAGAVAAGVLGVLLGAWTGR